jgi:hypothetical protein
MQENMGKRNEYRSEKHVRAKAQRHAREYGQEQQ